jgi:hypothetical protein
MKLRIALRSQPGSDFLSRWFHFIKVKRTSMRRIIDEFAGQMSKGNSAKEA